MTNYFLTMSNISVIKWPDNIDEVALVDEQSNKIATTCYRHNPGR